MRYAAPGVTCNLKKQEIGSEVSMTKIFVSCGQRKSTREIEVASKVCEIIKKRGFEVFLATETQSLGALTNCIYQEIEICEYFLFIDFKRDLCVDPTGKSKSFYRGSLFSHQELAIASYLEKECLLFREKGMPLEGIQQFLVSNAIEFDSANDSLYKQVEEGLKKWRSGWKNQLRIDVAQPVYEDAINVHARRKERYYHLSVFNDHYAKHAKNCYAYLLNFNCGPKGHEKIKNSEMIWSGYGTASMTILPKDNKELDIAVLSLENGLNCLIYFPSPATSSYYQPNAINLKKGDFLEARVKVVSDNFLPIVESFLITAKSNTEIEIEKGTALSEIIQDIDWDAE